MDCVNHPGVTPAAYCQNCGKALCANCVRREATGQVLCEPCWMAWHGAHGPYMGPNAPPANPALAGVLGFIPGVGAMYNGQFVKGFLHVIVFAVLVSMSHVWGLFGLLVAAWIFYQVFDAFQTAKARRDGQPLPDPLGMNELVGWFGHEFRRSQGMPPGPVPPGYAPPAAGQAPQPNPYQNPYPGTSYPGSYPGSYQGTPFQGGYQPPYAQYGAGYPPPPPGGFSPAVPPVPPVPPVPSMHWRRREPVAAIILIALGVLFLMGRMSWHVMQYGWPLLLIGLGVWLFVRRMRDTPPMPPMPPQPGPDQHAHDEDLQGGSR